MLLACAQPAPPMLSRPRTAPCPLQTLRRGDVGRAETEAFIADTFRRHHGAEVPSFAPLLVALRDVDGEIAAAAGWRSAGDGALYLERYLNAPIEQLLVRAERLPPPRQRIVEVGHLAASRPGAGRQLITRLAPHLAGLGFRWVASTLTEPLALLLRRLGVEPLLLGEADPARLGDDAARWGRYYEQRPQIAAGRLDLALRAWARRAAS